ncbi:hypothetical protein HON36_02530 [Candidatus Parcubacteria bacterium]|jgi:hypothetical protein|nr:hypothetical protein [Candidatus Parcubacteria bacterium]MBT7228673.1 hypothetical protein [Candidatus Parcubacteria bacterium]
MYKECPKAKSEIIELRRLFNAYVDGLNNAKKIEDLKILPHLENSIGDMRDMLSRTLGILLAEHYLRWMKSIYRNEADYETEGWVNDKFIYNPKTCRMETRSIDLSESRMTHLPKSLTIKGDLDMSMESNHSLQDLPDDLIVEGKLIIWWRDELIHKAKFTLMGQIGELVEDMSN